MNDESKNKKQHLPLKCTPLAHHIVYIAPDAPDAYELKIGTYDDKRGGGFTALMGQGEEFRYIKLGQKLNNNNTLTRVHIFYRYNYFTTCHLEQNVNSYPCKGIPIPTK